MRILILSLTLLAAAGLAVPLTAPAQASAAPGCQTFGSTDAAAAIVEARDRCFFTTVVRVDVGATVTWLNRDAEQHSIIGANQAWGATNILEPGSEISRRFTVSGVYPYYCRFHEGMVGAVIVGDAKGIGPVAPGSAPLVREGPIEAAQPSAGAEPGEHSFSTGEIVTYGGAFGALAAFIGLSIGIGLGRRGDPDED